MPGIPKITGDINTRPSGDSPIIPDIPTIVNPRIPSIDDTIPVKSPSMPRPTRPVPPPTNPTIPSGTNPVIETERGRLLYDKFIFNETKFTSLKYTSDSFNGANTSEPLIQKSISIPRLGRIANPRIVAKENQDRVTLLLNTTGRGYKFVQNQKNLTFSNSRIESTVFESSRLRFTPLAIYNPSLTLAQIGRDPSEQGEHYTRFGSTPFMDDTFKYLDVVSKNNTPGINSTNRLWRLRKNLGVGFEVDAKNLRIPSSFLDYSASIRRTLQGLGDFTNTITGLINAFGGNDPITNITNKITRATRVAINYLTPIDQYQGGPGSVNGAGVTTIRRFDFTQDPKKNDLINQLVKNKVSSIILTDESIPLDPPDTSKFDIVNKTTKTNLSKVQALETSTYTKLDPTLTNLTSYTYVISKPTASTGVSSAKTRKQSNINWTRNNGTNLLGNLGLLPIANNGKLPSVYEDTGIEDISETSTRMPIRFTIIDPFKGTEEKISFSAYLNGFKDNSTPNHTEISYIGRSEHFYVYNKFKRDVSFNFQIPCYSVVDLRKKHKDLAALYSSTMGKYNGNKLGGILYKLKLGNYLDNEAGIITNMSYDIPNDSSWDIDEQLAHNLNVSISYTVIHNDLPTYDSTGGLFTIKEQINISAANAIKNGTSKTQNVLNSLNVSKGGAGAKQAAQQTANQNSSTGMVGGAPQ
jgi:hypothetical protein